MMSQSPPPASDITQGTVQDVLYYDSHQLKHVSVYKVLQTVVKINKTKQNPVHRRQVLLVTSVVIHKFILAIIVLQTSGLYFFTIK